MIGRALPCGRTSGALTVDGALGRAIAPPLPAHRGPRERAVIRAALQGALPALRIDAQLDRRPRTAERTKAGLPGAKLTARSSPRSRFEPAVRTPGELVARHPQPRGRKPALRREIPSILRGFQGRLSRRFVVYFKRAEFWHRTRSAERRIRPLLGNNLLDSQSWW